MSISLTLHRLKRCHKLFNSKDCLMYGAFLRSILSRTATTAKNAISNTKTLVLDCDGVLWHGSSPIAGSFEALSYLKEYHSDLNIVFITNNSSKTRREYAYKLQSFGYPANVHNIITAGSLAAHATKQMGLCHVLMIGNDALKEELESQNITVVEVPGSPDFSFSESDFDSFYVDPLIEGVVLGWDKSFTYKKLCIASLYLQNGRRPFIVTNRDCADKTPNGRLLPVTGSLAASIEMASGVKSVLCGKPSKIAVSYILEQFSCEKSETLMVGDRLDTDIEFANIAGFKSCCVLTGCTNRVEAEQAQSFRKPTLIMHSFEDLVNTLR